MRRWRYELTQVLTELRELLTAPDADYTWSSWRDAEHAAGEVDGLLAELRDGGGPPGEVATIFLPTGPAQEVSLSSGWGHRFLTLADRVDAALAEARTPGEARFVCSLCGREAGVLKVSERDGRWWVRRESFTSVLECEAGPALRDVLASGTSGALFELDAELVPFHCPRCDACYCGRHWSTTDVFDADVPAWHDSIRGRCPEGHERMLED